MKLCECGCGQEVRKPIYRFFGPGHNRRKMNVNYDIPVSELLRLYEKERLSADKIAEIYNISTKSVLTRLRQNNIPRRVNAGGLRGVDSYSWRGGRFYHQHGYVIRTLERNDPFLCMADKNNQLPEHRLIMARQLNRPLAKSEIVHHKNDIKDDNRIENLELLSSVGEHTLKTMTCRNCELRKDIRLLKWQIKEQNEQIRNLTAKIMGVDVKL